MPFKSHAQRKAVMAKIRMHQYGAGVTARGKDDWIWQGYVTAPNVKEAKKFLTKRMKNKADFPVTAHINPYIKNKSNSKSMKIRTLR